MADAVIEAGRGTTTVAGNEAGLLPRHIGVDAGHPGVDLVGQQARAQRLNMLGPCRHRRGGGLHARPVMILA